MLKKSIVALLAAAVCFAPAIEAKKKKNVEKLYGGQTTQVTHPDWIQDAVIYEVNLRQGTPEGTLKAMQLQIPRLKDLGADILWLMPVHPISEKNKKGELGSYYAVQDYLKVNPAFGTIEDLKEFVRTAHANGMKVILDEVCNHTGGDNVWLTEHPDFYVRDKKGNLVSPYDWTDTYKLNYANPEMRKAMIDALKFWVKEADIDGYRCDVAGEVPTDFWNEARKELDAIKPVFMLAEASKPELTLAAFDADYNWPMKDLFNAIAATQGVNQYAVDKKQNLPSKNAQDIFGLVDRQADQYPKGAFSMNMVTNHDLNSWEGTEFDRYGKGLGAFAVLEYTLPGMPMLYSGQEVGFNHPFEFFKKDISPDYTANEFTAFYEMLNALKQNHPALNASNPESLLTKILCVNPNVIAFSRSTPDDEVIVVANLSSEQADSPLGVTLDGMTDYMTGSPAQLPSTLEPWQYFIFVPENN